MKKTSTFREATFAVRFAAIFTTALPAALAILAAGLLGSRILPATELEIDPNLVSKVDGVYEISSQTEPATIYSYSKPIDVVPGGLYRFKMNACWFGEEGGCFPAGVEGAMNDYNPAGEEPTILCSRILRVGNDRENVRLSVGRWESTKTIRFTEPTLVPACPIYKAIPAARNTASGDEDGIDEDSTGEDSVGENSVEDNPFAETFLPLGTGERIEGSRYYFHLFASHDDGNFARTLDYSDAPFNTCHWCLGSGQSVVYRFDLRPIRPAGEADGNRQSVEPLRFLSAQVVVRSKYFIAGRCVVELSADGQTWYPVGTLEEKGVITGSIDNLFSPPVETLYLRCRAEDTEKSAFFQIHGLELNAKIDSDRFTGQGETLFAEQSDGGADADRRFAVCPLYFHKKNIICRVTNQTDASLTWPMAQPSTCPTLSYTTSVDGGEPAACSANVTRIDSSKTSLAAGESGLFAVDLSNHPVGTETIEMICRFDQEYRVSQKIFPYFIQNYTRPLEGSGDTLDLSWCEADRKVPRSPWNIIPKEPEPIAIAAPRDDFEGFQIVVRPKGNLANLRAESSDLAGPGGEVIAKENIQIRWGYYHFVDTPTDDTCARDWYVDALVPMSVGSSGEQGAPLVVAAGENQPIFVTVYVPLGVGKGDYTGTLTIRTRSSEGDTEGDLGNTGNVGNTGDTVTQIPYKLTVWDFDQPAKNRFETGYGFDLGSVFTYQNISDESDKREIWEKYLKSASDHRISFYHPAPMDMFRVTFDKENLTANFDFTAFDAEMTRVMEKYNVTNFTVPVMGIGYGRFWNRTVASLAGFSADTPEYDKLMTDYLGKLQEHLREKGWLDKGYVYWYDEPEERDYDFVSEGFGRLKKYAPDLPRMLTEEPSDHFCAALDAVGGNIDIWCPISNNFSLPEARGRMDKGERFWWYVCTAPKAPYCTEFTDHPAHELRVWHWQAFERGITGSLIWVTNFWTSSDAFPDHRQNPYVDPMSYELGNGAAPGEKWYWGNGDGRLFYPPLAAAVPGNREGRAIKDDPVESIRLETLREGIEDYEILLTLRERYEAKKDTLTEEERARIEKIFDFSDITTDMTRFTDDPAIILQHRARAAEAIERLGK